MIIFQCCKRGQGLVVAKLPQADQQSGHQVDAAIMAIEISHFNITSRIPTLSPAVSNDVACRSPWHHEHPRVATHSNQEAEQRYQPGQLANSDQLPRSILMQTHNDTVNCPF